MAKAQKNLTPVIPGTTNTEAAAANSVQAAAPGADDPVLDAGGGEELQPATPGGVVATVISTGLDEDEEADYMEQPVIEPGAMEIDVKDKLIQDQQREIERLHSLLKAAGQNVPSRKTEAEAVLPDASTIDRTKIHGRVLTKQGWILPAGNIE